MTFSIKQAFQQAWETWKEHKGLVTGVFIIYLLINFIPDLLGFGFPFDNIGLIVLVQILKFVITAFALMGWLWVNLKLVNREPVKWTDFFAPISYLLRFVGGQLLFGLIVLSIFTVVLVPLFIVEGLETPDMSSVAHWIAFLTILAGLFFIVYLSLMFCFWTYYVLDKNASVPESFQLSASATKGHRFSLFLLFLLSVLLNIFGVLLFLVGLLITLPVTTLAWTHAYKKLKDQPFEVSQKS